MEEGGKTVLTCCNPDCRRRFSFPTPSNSGSYSVACPHCKAKNIFRVDKPDEPKPQKPEVGFLEDGSYRFVCSRVDCRLAVLVPKKSIKIGHNKVLCPKCGTEHEFDAVPTENELLKCQTADCKGHLEKPDRGDGIYSVTCGLCGQEYSLLVQNGKVVKTIIKTPPPPVQVKQWAMKLVTGRFLGKKEYLLSKGTHYIGRSDEECNSDFAINDKYASKRSVRIDVNLNGENLVYKLTVERAMNPVYHNSRELTVGDIVYITYGDTLKLGKTVIKVQKCK